MGTGGGLAAPAGILGRGDDSGTMAGGRGDIIGGTEGASRGGGAANRIIFWRAMPIAEDLGDADGVSC